MGSVSKRKGSGFWVIEDESGDVIASGINKKTAAENLARTLAGKRKKDIAVAREVSVSDYRSTKKISKNKGL